MATFDDSATIDVDFDTLDLADLATARGGAGTGPAIQMPQPPQLGGSGGGMRDPITPEKPAEPSLGPILQTLGKRKSAHLAAST